VPWREIPVLHERTSVSPRAPEFAILCASRINEVVLARGDEFDLANARLSIPAERMKVGKPRTVTLAKHAVEILRDLHPGGPNPDELVFGITGAALTKMGACRLRRCDGARHRTGVPQDLGRRLHRLQGCG
jgi:integrase